MSDKGIIFSAPMVRALLAGRKTQTRRLVKPTMRDGVNPSFSGLTAHRWGGNGLWMLHGSEEASLPFKVPYATGDRLYVREAHSVRGVYSDVVEVGYRASERASHTEFVEQWPVDLAKDAKGRGPKVAWPAYKPSIHMPRWASRLTLLVSDVRVQRLQEINLADARAEGCAVRQMWLFGADQAERNAVGRRVYRQLWDSLHTKPGETWAENPWIVAVTFDVRRGNIDR